MKPYLPKINDNFVGRVFERTRLTEIAEAGVPAIVVVHGRRRVGKTELIQQTLRGRNLIKLEGIEGKPKEYQIKSTLEQISRYSGQSLHAELGYTSWRQVLLLLAELFREGCWTLFLEELQWLSCYDDELVSELKYVWDNHFRNNRQFLLILCGSAPSFMVKKVVHSKALYNRSLHEISLKQFSIDETSAYFGKQYQRREIMDAYLSVGGIPEYLSYLRGGSSILLGLAADSFRRGGFFTKEKDRIFVSSFAARPEYQAIAEFLSLRPFASRDEIAKAVGLSSGGGLSEILLDLEQCEFIERYTPYFAKSRSTLSRYAIADNYLQFHVKFIAPILKNIERGEFNLQPLKALPLESFGIWLGYAFERFCRHNSRHIADLLGFGDVSFTSGSYFSRRSQRVNSGFQWDLVFERKDKVYTICEVKYTESPVGTSVVEDFEHKLALFEKRRNYRIQRVLISAAGASEAVMHRAYFDRILSLADLIKLC